MEKRRRKYQRKQAPAHIRARWTVLRQISADTKDLAVWHDHSPVHRAGNSQWPVARGVSQKRSAVASAVFASRTQEHLDRYGDPLRDLVWQKDSGGEFNCLQMSDIFVCLESSRNSKQ